MFQEDDLWVVKASSLSHHMMDDRDVTPCLGLSPLTAEGQVTTCYFSPFTDSNPVQEPVSPYVRHLRDKPKTITCLLHVN